jgi:molybdate transport system substrate-binding protein
VPIRIALTLVLALATAGRASPVASVGTVRVFAAASLTETFRALAQEFEAAHPKAHVELNFAGTPTLVGQILQGAPADVLAAADEVNMQRVADAHRLAAAPVVFARNRLSIVVTAGNPARIERLSDLTRSGLVVALCAADVPAGRYAAEAFARAGVPVPESSREVDVKAVLMKVALGEADAGVVYVTDVRAGGARVAGIAIPEAENVVARYPIGVVEGGDNRAGGEAFVAFVLSEAGQRILASFGFLGR